MSETNAENSADPFQEHSGVLVNPIVGVLRQFAALLPFVGVYCLAVGYPGVRWEVQLFWTLWTAYFLFCWTSLFHETVHLTLPRPPRSPNHARESCQALPGLLRGSC